LIRKEAYESIAPGRKTIFRRPIHIGKWEQEGRAKERQWAGTDLKEIFPEGSFDSRKKE